MKETTKRNYTYRIDGRTYVIRVWRSLELGGVYVIKTQTTYIAAGGGRVAKGARRIV